MSAEPVELARVRAGQILAGRYAVEAALDGSGPHRVFTARHLRLDRPVVATLVDAADVEATDALRRELRVAAALRHPHVVRVLDLLRPSPAVWLAAVEQVQGETLAEHLARRGRLSLEETLALVRPLADVLAHAHAHGVVARGPSAEDVLLVRTRGGAIVPKLVGLGVSRERAGLPPRDTARDERAPELDAGSAPSPASDVYSLGALAIRCLTGDSRAGLGEEIASEPAVRERLRAAVPGADAATLEVLVRAVSPRPSRRWPDGAALLAALGAGAPSPSIGGSLEPPVITADSASEAPRIAPTLRMADGPSPIAPLRTVPLGVVRTRRMDQPVARTQRIEPPQADADASSRRRWLGLAAIALVVLLLGAGAAVVAMLRP